MRKLEVKPATVDTTQGWGITYGEHWFFWLYTQKESAEKMVLVLNTPRYHAANVCHDKPYRVSEILPEEIADPA